MRLWRNRHWTSRFLVLGVLLYGLYLGFAALAVPSIAREVGNRQLSALTGRDVRIGAVRVNPFLLRVGVHDFSISDAQTDVLMAFTSLSVDFELSSLWRRRWHFDQLYLDGLDLRVQHNGGSAFNFDSLLRHLQEQQQDHSEVPAEGESGGDSLPSISVRDLALTQGSLRFTEASGAHPEHLILPVDFQVSDFSTVGTLVEAESGIGPAEAMDGGSGAIASATGEAMSDNRHLITLTGPKGGVLRWQGHFSVAPLHASGVLSVDNIRLAPILRLGKERMAFAVPTGGLSMDARYHFAAEPVPRLQLSDVAFTLEDFVLRSRDEKGPRIALPRLAIRGGVMDSQAQTIEVGEVELDALALEARLTSEGLDLLDLFRVPEAGAGLEVSERDTASGPAEPFPELSDRADTEGAMEPGGKAAEAIAGDSPPPGVGSPWQVMIAAVRLNDSRVAVIDATLEEPQEISLDAIQLSIEDLQIADQISGRFAGGLQMVDGQLRFQGEGRTYPTDLRVSAQAEAIDLARLAPWIRSAIPLEVRSGDLEADLNFVVQGQAPDITVDGRLGLQELHVDEATGPLMQLADGSVNAFAANVREQSIAIEDVALRGLQLTNRVDADGLDAAARLALASGAAEGNTAPVEEPGAPWVVQIEALRLADGLLRHQDATVVPAFAIALHQLAGSVDEIDTRPGSRLGVNITALVDNSAPLSLEGSLAVDPLFADLKVSLNSYDMRPLTPYTSSILGYTVDKGQLGVDSTVSLKDSILQSGAEITANQFYLGNKVPSESAIKAPVKLGLAVLRNRHGRIRLPVRIGGNVSDPQFSVGGVIANTIGNIIVTAATAPFSMLSALTGGRDLRQIAYPAGAVEATGEAMESLQALRKVLIERPDLAVTLSGNAGAEDRRALAALHLGRTLVGDAWPGIDSALTTANMRETLMKTYRDHYERDAEALVSDSQQADGDASVREVAIARAAWEQLLEDAIEALPRSKIQAFANARTRQARIWLLQQGDDEALSPGRIFTESARIGGAFSGLTLTLR